MRIDQEPRHIEDLGVHYFARATIQKNNYI
jgi:hypothetical protein